MFRFSFCRVSIFHIKIAFSSIQISEGDDTTSNEYDGQCRRVTGGYFYARRKEVNVVLHITKEQEEQICSLVRKRCANYRRGNCLLLNGLRERTCVQLLCRSGIFCRYFQEAVLPREKELYTQILSQNEKEE